MEQPNEWDDVVVDNPKAGKKISADPRDISNLLGGYKTNTMSMVKENEHESTPSSEQPKQEYYKTGKKAGQPKPSKLKVTTQPAEAPAEISGELITGALFITLIDMFVPMFIIGINNFVSKDKMEYEHLQMQEKQIKTLTPVSDAVVKQLKLTGNPVLIMIISLIGVYGIKFMMLKRLNKKS